jgi:D-alanyl-D-alanine carboxypeptidase
MSRRLFPVTLTLVLSFALAVPPAGAAPAATRADRAQALQQKLDAVHAAGMPGVSAEVRDGAAAWELASGVADVRTGRPVRPWFRHRVGSITKTFVATTLLQLVGERRLRLDAPIAAYLPDVVPGDLGRTVTVRMLLNHTSGIGDYDELIFADPERSFERVRTQTYTPRQLVALGLHAERTNAPGARWSYSNTNYIVLGLLIERLTGRPYAAEVGRRIVRPLGLRNTYFPGTDPYLRGPHSAAYVPWFDGTLRDFTVYNMSWAWAAGELISTPQDLNRFYRALFTGRLLKPAQFAAMTTTVPTDPADPEGLRYGLGLLSVPGPCGRGWGHDGGVIGQIALSLHSLDGRRQLTVAENMAFYQTPGQPHPIDAARGDLIVEALCGQSSVARSSGSTARFPLTPGVAFRR